MCFSATTSFTTAALLLLCGIAALYRAKKNQFLFAMIPLLFAIQQFIEGTIWQSLTSGTYTFMGAYAYLIFVFIIWPNWIPFSIYFMTSRASEKKTLALPIMAGILMSILAATYLIIATPHVAIEGYHIKYTAHVPPWVLIPGTALYLFATITPFFIATIPHLWIIGIILALSYIVSLLFYYTYIISIWCFFAALLSILILIIIK